jgi:hypothetical protein
MVALSLVGLVIFGFGAASAVHAPAKNVIVRTATLNARLGRALGSVEFEQPEIMALV